MKTSSLLFVLCIFFGWAFSGEAAPKLPPVDELLKLTGDSQKGHVVFTTFCITCHRIGGEGADFGPSLSDVGTRLPKLEIFKSILEPSVTIVPGFETQIIRLTSGEMLTGLIAAQNDSEVTLRVSATDSRIVKRADIKSIKKSDLSIMPAAQAEAIGQEKLVDLVAFLAAPFPPSPAKLELRQGDHIAIVGNGLADRMQHDGTLEALIHKTFPQHDLVIRNLGFAGDEVETRMRSENFGSPDDWLKRVKADVIFAFFGFNESFAGPAGLPKFRSDLDKYIKGVKAADFSGKGAPRLVLFSPIAQEKMSDPNLPDPAANNVNIQLYSTAVAEIAKANSVQFVDLFSASQKLYAAAKQPLTFNGIHLTVDGYRVLAPVIFKGLFGAEPEVAGGALEPLRAAVQERNSMWFSRYRTVDGYNVYGGRSFMKYNGVLNRDTMLEEMAVRDAMTANREQRVWALSRGYDQKVDDTNVPKVAPVPTNKPDAKPYLKAEEGIAQMTVPAGVKVNVFASEEDFPDLIKPVQMAWDTKGRLWVAVWPTYPERMPWDAKGDSIIILEDAKGTGKADKCTTFISGLNCPTGFQFYKDGILLMQAPDLWFVQIDPATGKAGKMERVLNGIDSADSHHTTNAMALEPGGATYLSDGVFHRTQVETAAGVVRNSDAAIYRYEPLAQKFERYVPYGFANPHGRVFDFWGNDYITDATGNSNYFGPAFSGHIDYPATHASLKNFWKNPSRPCPGTGILSSRAWPAEFNGNFLNCNVIGFQGVYRAKIEEDGSGMKGESLENLLVSKDPNFRPMQAMNGPDGAVYVSDWSNAIIGHLQHHLRDPNRDHTHGRIYRLLYEGKTMTPPVIDGQPIEALLALLKEPENNTRERAKVELGKHETASVMAAVDKWVAGLDAADANYTHNLTEALWVKQWHNVVDANLLKKLLRSPDYHARFAATRVLCYQRDRVPEALALLKVQAGDEHPRVRLEAVRAASFFRQWEAADVALFSLTQPTDYYLDYCLKETIKQLEPWWKKAIADGSPLCADNPKGIDYILNNVSTANLANLPKTPGVYHAMLTRGDSSHELRLEALNALAKQRAVSPLAMLLETLQSAGDKSSQAIDDLGQIMLKQPAADLKAAHAALEKCTAADKPAVLRQYAHAALMTTDNSIEPAWNVALKSPPALNDFLNALPLVSDAALRATAYEKVFPLVSALPPELAVALANSHGAAGRFVRVELPKPGTLTLAEVQIFVDGKNIGPSGKAKQSSTAYGGDAQRAIDGKTTADFSAGTSTHTNENDPKPWWEVDLHTEHPIESVAVWNRDGALGQRLDGFSVVVLDANRREVFRKAGIPAPKESVKIELKGDLSGSIQRAAMQAAVSTGKEPGAVGHALVALMKQDKQVVAAARALRQLPREALAQEDIADAVASIIRWGKAIPAAGRTAPDYVQTLTAARDLTALIKGDTAAATLKEIRALTVDVFHLKTIREQMRYDSTRIIAEAGKPFEVILENGDMMPHNIVFVMNGARKEVAQAAETMRPEKLDGQGRAYVPASDKIFAASKMVQPGQSEKVQVNAPAAEGEYEYVCTMPGHWTLMFGLLVVTKDPDAYLLAHPTPPAQAVGPMPHEHKH